jgi:elongation factor P
MAIPATQLRPGMIIKHNNDLHSVFSVEHRTPGNLRAFIQAKLRNLRTGAMFEHRFRSPDPIEKIVVDEVDMEYLYSDGDDFYFMNTESYEQTHLKRDTLGDAVEYLTPNLQIKVEFYDGKAVGIELPQTVELVVVATEPGLKSATASSVTKPAKLETGLVVVWWIRNCCASRSLTSRRMISLAEGGISAMAMWHESACISDPMLHTCRS